MQEYWNQAMAYYHEQDTDTRSLLFVASVVTAIAFVLGLLRVFFWTVAWVTRPLRADIAKDTRDSDIWAEMENLRQQITNQSQGQTGTDEDLPLADDVDDETDLYLAIKTLGKANARLAALTDTALKTFRKVTDKLCDTTTNVVQAVTEAHSTVAQQICEEGRTALVQAVAAASPFVVKPESKLDDEDEE